MKIKFKNGISIEIPTKEEIEPEEFVTKFGLIRTMISYGLKQENDMVEFSGEHSTKNIRKWSSSKPLTAKDLEEIQIIYENGVKGGQSLTAISESLGKSKSYLSYLLKTNRIKRMKNTSRPMKNTTSSSPLDEKIVETYTQSKKSGFTNAEISISLGKHDHWISDMISQGKLKKIKRVIGGTEDGINTNITEKESVREKDYE